MPHDFRIRLDRDPSSPGTEDEAYYPGGFGRYERDLDLDPQTAAGRVLIAFDGAYRFAEVRVNRQLVCLHKGGYSPFTVDISDFVEAGRNTINVITNCAMLPASRWYTGAGIYREVRLLTGTPPCIAPHGVTITTRTAREDESRIFIETRVLPDEAAAHAVRHTVCDAAGHTVATGPDGELAIAHARLWCAESPYLYTLTTDVLVDGVVNDTVKTPFGIRTIAVDATHGLTLNGRPVLLKGGCIHHDNGIVGAISLPAIEVRKVRLLKAAGFNAIRCSHNPPSTALLDACDALGLYVIDEAFDAWREGKRAFDEHLFFEDEWENEITAMISRDRNHPAVILWSTGNEIYERCGASDGAAWSRRLAETVRKLDPTRPVTNALCGFYEDAILADTEANLRSTTGAGKDFWARKSEAYAEPLDVVGYNYLLDRYAKDARLFPSRVICGTESFPLQARENWEAVKTLPHVIGDFVWTAWDYLGESGIGHSDFGVNSGHQHRFFPWHVANCGDFDICGRKRPQSHFRDFVWTDRTTPYIGVQHPARHGQEEIISAWGWADITDAWTFPGHEGRPITVIVYSAGDTVCLSLNGAPLAEAAVEAFTATFEIAYQPGTLRVESFREKTSLGAAELRSHGEPARIEVGVEAPADDDIRFIDVTLRDADGVRATTATEAVTLDLTGAELLGFGGGDPASGDNYSTPIATPCNGRLLAVIRLTQPDAKGVLRYRDLACTATLHGNERAVDEQ